MKPTSDLLYLHVYSISLLQKPAWHNIQWGEAIRPVQSHIPIQDTAQSSMPPILYRKVFIYRASSRSPLCTHTPRSRTALCPQPSAPWLRTHWLQPTSIILQQRSERLDGRWPEARRRLTPPILSSWAELAAPDWTRWSRLAAAGGIWNFHKPISPVWHHGVGGLMYIFLLLMGWAEWEESVASEPSDLFWCWTYQCYV